MKINLDKIEKEHNKNDTGNLQLDINNLLLQKQKTEATETIAQHIQATQKIYTTRDDKNSEVWIYQKGIYIPSGKTYIKEITRKLLGVAYTPHLKNQVLEKIEADTYIDQEEFFNNNIEDEICCETGILNLRTRELTEFNQDKIFFTKIPVEYNPQAVCPGIESFFKSILKNAEDSKVMFELFGFLLYKNYFIEKAVMFIGDGRNGKGKTIDLMKRFIGVKNASSVPLQQFETDQFAAGELFNKLANLPGDLDSRTLNNTGTFKTLTGRDLISAPRKYLSRVSFVNHAKMVFACNKLPRTKDTSIAFWNRWVLFEFPFTFLSEQEINNLSEDERKKVKLRDTEIIDKISNPEELSGLLNKALDGLQDLLEKKDFSVSKGIKEIKDLWIRKSDSFLAFCLDNIEEANEVRIEKKVLRKKYIAFCKLHKVKAQSDKALRETLFENYPVSEERDESGRYWEGISFRHGEIIEDLKGAKSY